MTDKPLVLGDFRPREMAAASKDGSKNTLLFFRAKREGRRETRPDESASRFSVDPKHPEDRLETIGCQAATETASGGEGSRVKKGKSPATVPLFYLLLLGAEGKQSDSTFSLNALLSVFVFLVMARGFSVWSGTPPKLGVDPQPVTDKQPMAVNSPRLALRNRCTIRFLV